MDVYNAWFDLKPGVSDADFVGRIEAFLSHLKGGGKISGFRLMRRKLGLAPSELGEFHLMIEIEGLAQLDDAFETVAERSEPIESLHHAVNREVTNLTFGLYRDFPDPFRKSGEEKF